MKKRLYVSYRDDKIYGDTPEAIARKISSYSQLGYLEALDYVNKVIRKTDDSPTTYKAPQKKKKLEFKDYLHGAEALISVSAGNSVNQLEINRRASICQTCPRLEEVPGCMSCGFAGTLSNTINKIKRFFKASFEIPNNMGKHGCGVCGCSLAVMLPAKTSAFKKDDQAQRPDHCWVRKTSDNYIETL